MTPTTPTYDEAWINRKAAELLPKVRANFIWVLAAQTQENKIKLPAWVEPGPDGVSPLFHVSWFGIKQVVKGGEGETPIASGKPVAHSFSITVHAGAPIALLAATRKLGGKMVASLCDRPGSLRETTSSSTPGLLSPVAQVTTGVEQWLWSWPA